MPHTLRSFLESIDNRVLHIHDPVDPVSQVGYLCSESKGPLLFENLDGFPGWRLTDILIKDRRGQAAALGLDGIKEVCPFLAKQMSAGPGKSKMVKDAPVQEVVLEGADADIRKVPIPIHSAGDAGRYLGSGVTITRDPETGIRNESILRMQLTDDPHKAPFWMAARHNYSHYLKYVAKNEPMPMAFAIGLHPVYEIMANWSGRHENFDELEYAAGVLGETVEMVKCRTIDLEVPAHAEIVIEGTVHPTDRMMEGPFGEFTTLGTGAEGPAPIFTVSAITHRKDPIFRHMQATWFTDHQPLITLPMEAAYYNRLKETHGNSNIIDVFVPPWASQFMMIVQMEAKWDGQVGDVLMSALSGPNLHVKTVIAVSGCMAARGCIRWTSPSRSAATSTR
jgi:2,5-furandicarboxylate decarboxylase 1